MARYIVKRVISAIITLWFVLTITFLLMHAIPGDPFTSERQMDPKVKEAVYAKYGFDKPLYVQYFKYVGNFLKGDFGVSFKKIGVSVKDIIEDGFPYSLKVGIWASLMVIVIGIPFGVVAALHQNGIFDRLAMILATLGATIPSFVIATGFLYIFSRQLGVVPAFGVKEWTGYIGPTISLGVFSLSYITRLTRTSLLEVLQQDYIRTARAKGLSEGIVIWKHALRNALIPIVTYLGPMIAGITTGSFVVEKVFGIPGIGQLFTTSITDRDYTVIMGITMFYSVLLVVSVIFVDILYVLVDPRIKFE